MEDDLDLVVFEDDEGNELTMEVLDYFFYEGQEYALLAEVQENCDACEDGCEECEAEREVGAFRNRRLQSHLYPLMLKP
jgi:hypothetical protein